MGLHVRAQLTRAPPPRQTWSDMDNVRVVFVASDGLFVTKMRGAQHTHTPRAAWP